MDPITVTPKKIRGLGNVLSPKSSNNFGYYNSDLTEDNSEINEKSVNTFILNYDENYNTVDKVLLTTNNLEYLVGDRVKFQVQVLTSKNRNVANAHIIVFMNNVNYGAFNTDVNGFLEFGDTCQSVGEFKFRAYCNGIISDPITINVTKQGSNIAIEE